MGNSETERIRGGLDLSRHPTRGRHPTRHTGPLSARDAGVLPGEPSVAASVGRRVLPSAIVTRAHRARPATRRHLPPQRPGPPDGEYCSRWAVPSLPRDDNEEGGEKDTSEESHGVAEAFQ